MVASMPRRAGRRPRSPAEPRPPARAALARRAGEAGRWALQAKPRTELQREASHAPWQQGACRARSPRTSCGVSGAQVSPRRQRSARDPAAPDRSFLSAQVARGSATGDAAASEATRAAAAAGAIPSRTAAWRRGDSSPKSALHAHADAYGSAVVAARASSEPPPPTGHVAAEVEDASVSRRLPDRTRRWPRPSQRAALGFCCSALTVRRRVAQVCTRAAGPTLGQLPLRLWGQGNPRSGSSVGARQSKKLMGWSRKRALVAAPAPTSRTGRRGGILASGAAPRRAAARSPRRRRAPTLMHEDLIGAPVTSVGR